VVIDVGKNFQAAAVEWFPKYGLREIDAVIITHAHADGWMCLFGLDDGADCLDSHEWLG
jgi:predicted metal-dependent RNase